MSKPVRPDSDRASAPPAPGEGKRGPQGHIGYLLRQAQGALRQAGDAELAPLGLTLPQFAILTLLGAYGALSGAELARLAVQTPQTIDAVTKNLVRDRLVEKSPDPVHGRILRLGLTAAGAKALATAKRRVNGLERRLVAGLDPDEERIVRAWLAGVARDLLPRS